MWRPRLSRCPPLIGIVLKTGKSFHLSISKPTQCLEKQEGLRQGGNLRRVKILGRPVRDSLTRLLKISDSSRIVAGAARRPALFPQLFPIPDPGHHLVRQPESELMREHTHLARWWAW